MGIIRQITDTVYELSSTYLQSALPKPIKKYIFKRQLKRIEKIINKIPEDGKITFLDLVEFSRDLYVKYYLQDGTSSNAKYENIYVELSAPDRYRVQNAQEYGIFITLSENSYIKIHMVYNNIDYKSPKYDCSITIRTLDKFNYPVSYSSMSFTKYQEISPEVIDLIAKEDQLSDKAVEYFNLVLITLCVGIKKYLKSYIGIYDSINL